jgi:hypothetical protein
MIASLQEIIYLFETTRVRQTWPINSSRTLKDMARLPAHLVDDVNARGLPLDHRSSTSSANQFDDAPSVIQFRRIKADALRSV